MRVGLRDLELVEREGIDSRMFLFMPPFLCDFFFSALSWILLFLRSAGNGWVVECVEELETHDG